MKTNHKQRVELHCHTNRSVLDGVSSVEELLMFAVMQNMSAIAITDHGNVLAYEDAWYYSKEYRLNEKTNIIYGMEACVTDDIFKNKENEKEEQHFSLYHVIILIQNEEGKLNLFKLVSEAEQKNKKSVPVIPWSELMKNREGLIIGSVCDAGQLFCSVRDGKPMEVLENIAKRFDYIEVQPASNYHYLIDDQRCPYIKSVEDIERLNQKIINIADRLKLPVVATSDAHYIYPEDSMKRELVQRYTGYENAKFQTDLHLRTTDEMLGEFEYLGKEKAWEIVVENSNVIADKIEVFNLFSEERYPILPDVDDADERLEEICFESLRWKYGAEVGQDVIDVLNWELNGIRESGSAGVFIIIRELLTELDLSPYQIGFRYSLGSSLVAYLCGITCVDPITAGLSPEFYYGVDGNKLVEIDLIVPSEWKEKAWEMCSDLEGVGAAFHVGSCSTISEDKAADILFEYEKSHDGWRLTEEKRQELMETLTLVVEERGILNSGRMVLVPEWYDIYEFTPVMDSLDGKYMVTVMGQLSSELLYKLNVQSCYSTDMSYRLMCKTGVNVADISLEDSDIIKMFQIVDTEEGVHCMAVGIPRFDNSVAFRIVKEFKPTCFEDIVKIIGMLHSTGAWKDNGELLLKNHMTDRENIIGNREDVYDYLLCHGMDRETAYKITDDVRKGKGLKLTDSEMCAYSIPDWYKESCDKIRYLFSRADAYRYALDTWWCAWFKLHYSQVFYETYFELLEVRL